MARKEPEMSRFSAVFILSIVAALIPTSFVYAQETGELLSSVSEFMNGQEDTEWSGRIIQLIAIMTVLSIAPGLLIMMTSFTRFVIVLSMLRSALGLNQTPPNMVLVSLAMFMTFFVMQPVMDRSWQEGLQPLLRNEITEEQAIERISTPIKEFMFANTREKDMRLFLDLDANGQQADVDNQDETGVTVESVSWRTLIPAFMISEIRRAFEIGFLIFLPFIAIDLIVASVLMSAGMMMLPPIMVSLPFKVIFFVLIDGWYMLVGSLVQSYTVMGV